MQQGRDKFFKWFLSRLVYWSTDLFCGSPWGRITGIWENSWCLTCNAGKIENKRKSILVNFPTNHPPHQPPAVKVHFKCRNPQFSVLPIAFLIIMAETDHIGPLLVGPKKEEVSSVILHHYNPFTTSRPSTGNLSSNRTVSNINDELWQFRLGLLSLGLEQLTVTRVVFSWVFFLLFAFIIPLCSFFFVVCPHCKETERHPFEKTVQISESALCVIAFLCLYSFLRTYGLRRMLFLDQIGKESTEVQDGYQKQLQVNIHIYTSTESVNMLEYFLGLSWILTVNCYAFFFNRYFTEYNRCLNYIKKEEIDCIFFSKLKWFYIRHFIYIKKNYIGFILFYVI